MEWVQALVHSNITPGKDSDSPHFGDSPHFRLGNLQRHKINWLQVSQAADVTFKTSDSQTHYSLRPSCCCSSRHVRSY